jgi:uncharacterized protein (DUF58 family)
MRLTSPFSRQSSVAAAVRRRIPSTLLASGATARTATSERLFDEELLARLRRLTLLSRRTIAEGLAGEHRSRRRGASPEFADFKSYSQGDDFRRIDWNTYARLDGLFVRLSEVTTEFSVHILLDASNSMAWQGGGSTPSKFTYARRAAGALAYVSLWHFDRIVIAPFGETIAPAFGPAQGRAHVVSMLRFLEQLAPMGGTDLPTTIDAYVRARNRPAVLIVASDLLSGEPGELREALRTARSRGWETIVVHVLDPAELTPALMTGDDGARVANQPTELLEVESGQRLRLTPTDGVIADYERAVTSWLNEVEAACEEERVEYVRLLTDWPFDTVVLRLLHERGLVE